jgi:hypothetical protein
MDILLEYQPISIFLSEEYFKLNLYFGLLNLCKVLIILYIFNYPFNN